MHVPLRALCVCAALACAASAADGPAGAVEQRVEAGIELMNQRKPAEGRAALGRAAKDLAGAIAANPNDARAYFLLAKVQWHLEQDGDAAASIARAVELAPNEACYHHFRGAVLAGMEQHDDALAALATAARLAPDNLDYRFAHAHWYAEHGKPERAEKMLRAIVDDHPTDARALGGLAAALAGGNKEQQEEALSLLIKATALDPNYQNGLRNLGQLYQSLGRTEDSAEVYESLLQVAPDDFQALSKLVQSYTALGKDKERDRHRARLFELYKAGKLRQAFYCREQFKVDRTPVMVFEYFELKGEMGVRYSFNVLDEAGKKAQRRVSLGSYEMTTRMARETGSIGPNERMYHLDGYEGRSHATYGMYTKEPTYEATRAMVVKVLKGELKAKSSTTVPEGK